MLAGVSVDYYTRLERGRLGGASESVLDAIARVLQLDDDEPTHLYDLARNVAPGSRRKRPKPTSPITAAVQQVLDSMSVPAIVQSGRLDLLAANDLGRALYSRSTTWPSSRRTSPASCSSTRAPRASTPTSTPARTSSSPCFAPPPACFRPGVRW